MLECQSCIGAEPGSRRGFFAKLTAVFAGALALLTPLGAGLVSFLYPLSKKGGATLRIRLASLDALTDLPTRFTVKADREDAWVRENNVPIGNVYLRKTADGDVLALQALCPHAGCMIAVQGEGDATQFVCPCHKALFDLDGVQLPESTESPRDMDPLEVEIVNDTEVWVSYQDFRLGATKREPI